ncbi:MAG: energy transducer TonB [Bryobacterales bacterium]|nr:energy transducer TonB [Bryobacterales bacterium]
MWPKALERAVNQSADTPADVRAWNATKTALRLEATAAFANQLHSLLRDAPIEMSGILLGRKLEGRPPVILLRSLQTVDGAQTLGDWQEALSRPHRSTDQLLGFFRIRQRQGLEFTINDQEIANTLFSEPDQVFLIIRNQGGAITAGVYWRQGESIEGELAYPLWPAPIPVSTPPPPPPALRPPLPPQSPQPYPTNRLLIAFLSLFALIGLLAIGTLAGIEIIRRLPKWPTPEPTFAVERRPLSLDVRLEGSRMLITWDTNAPTIRSAESGSLRITDGASDRTIVMDAADLMVGRVAYLPTAERVQLQLDVRTKNSGLVSEVIRVLHAAAAPSAGPAVTTAQPVPQVRNTVQPVVERVKTPPRPPAPAPASASAPQAVPPPVVAERADLTKTKAEGGEELTELVIPPQATNLALLTQVAPIATPNPAPPASAPPPLPTAPPVRPPKAQPVPQVAAEPPAQAIAPLNPTPAIAIAKVAPSVSTALQRYLQKEETVNVEVSINAQGLVERARALPGSFKVLEPTAEMAARQWRFRPATIRGRPVSSTSVLQFVFTKK